MKLLAVLALVLVTLVQISSPAAANNKKVVQAALNALGYKAGKVDGSFGKGTCAPSLMSDRSMKPHILAG